jgi:uncharacterized RDD family membrane protein YckC
MTGVSEAQAGQARTSGASGPRAGFWQRFFALFLDSILIAIVNVILGLILKGAPAAYYVVSVIVDWGYYTALEGGPRGQTLGMRALGIRVIDYSQGGSIGYGRALIRQVVKLLSGFVILLGYFWMLWDREKQCWHDKAANDVVVPVLAYPVSD